MFLSLTSILIPLYKYDILRVNSLKILTKIFVMGIFWVSVLYKMVQSLKSKFGLFVFLRINLPLIMYDFNFLFFYKTALKSDGLIIHGENQKFVILSIIRKIMLKIINILTNWINVFVLIVFHLTLLAKPNYISQWYLLSLFNM